MTKKSKPLSFEDFAKAGETPPGKREDVTGDWYNQTEGDAPDSVSSWLAATAQDYRRRLDQYIVSTRLYGNLPIFGIMGANFTRLSARYPWMRERVTFNAIASATDTITARVTKNKPRPMHLTSGGNYKQQRKAKRLNQLSDGLFYENRTYDKGTDVFRDGGVLGDGFIGVHVENDRIVHERVMATELRVDEEDGFYGTPRQMHRVMNVDRDLLKARYPGHDAAIDRAPLTEVDTTMRARVANKCTVRESWYLPSGPDADDGRHIVTVDVSNDGALTEMETWKHPFFPFARFRWAPRLYGYWSQGGAEKCQGLQLDLTRNMQNVSKTLHLGATAKILAPNGAKLTDTSFSNMLMSIIHYQPMPGVPGGGMPTWMTPQLVQPEIYQYIATTIQRIYDDFGVSEMSASGELPVGVREMSGKAIRAYDDVTSSARFNTIARAYENLFLEVDRIQVALVRDLAKKHGGKYEVRSPMRRFLESVNWSDVDIEEDEFERQVFPTSSLPNDPAGRLQTVQEYAQAGYLTPRQARRLLDFPDLDAEENLGNAEEDWLIRVCEQIIDEGEVTALDDHDDFALAREIAMEFYAFGKLRDVEPERLAMLDGMIKDIDQRTMEAMQAQAQMQASMTPPPAPGATISTQGGAPAAPQAVPMPPPVSRLLRNAPRAQGH